MNEFNQWFIILLSIRGISWNVHQIWSSLFAGLLFLLLLSIRGFSWNYTTFATSLLKSFSYCYQFGAFHEMCIKFPLIIYGAFIFDGAINSGLFLKIPSNSHIVKCGTFHVAINSGYFMKLTSIWSSSFAGFYLWWRYQFGAFHENAIKFPPR